MARTKSVYTLTLKNWLDAISSNCNGNTLAIKIESNLLVTIFHAWHPTLNQGTKTVFTKSMKRCISSNESIKEKINIASENDEYIMMND